MGGYGQYIHGFGIPQAVEGWQQGQARRKQEKFMLEALDQKREELKYNKTKDAFDMILKASNLFSNKKFLRSPAAPKTAQFIEKTIKSLYPDTAQDFKLDYKGNVKGQLKEFKLTNLANEIQGATFKNQGGVAASLSEAYDNGDVDENQYNLFKSMLAENVKASRPKELSPRDAAFQNLSPAEKKQALLKPDIQITMDNALKKQEASENLKQRLMLKTPAFRANIQKDVMALNKNEWGLWDSTQKKNAIRVETDKRVRQVSPNAQYGEINGVKGWYVKKDGKFELISPWNE